MGRAVRISKRRVEWAARREGAELAVASRCGQTISIVLRDQAGLVGSGTMVVRRLPSARMNLGLRVSCYWLGVPMKPNAGDAPC